MAERADVAIIGAGVIGTSVAFQLARLGGARVVLLEKEALPGTGSTAKANGGIRAQFTTESTSRCRSRRWRSSTPSRTRSASRRCTARPATSS